MHPSMLVKYMQFYLAGNKYSCVYHAQNFEGVGACEHHTFSWFSSDCFWFKFPLTKKQPSLVNFSECFT